MISSPVMYRGAAVLVVLDLMLAPQLLSQSGAQDTWLGRSTYCVPPDRAFFQRDGTGWKADDWESTAARSAFASGDPGCHQVEYFERVEASGYLTPWNQTRRGHLIILACDGVAPTAAETGELRNALADRLVAQAADPHRSNYYAGRAARLRGAPWSTHTTAWMAILNDCGCALLATVGALSFAAAGLRARWESFQKRGMKAGYCRRCSYDLRGLSRATDSTAVCPECGLQNQCGV